jgi:translation initiation factor 2 alpha subunit (eIF-2alpha)
LIPKVVRVEKPDEADQVRQLKKQIRQLQEALGKTQLENVMNESFLRIACEQLGMDFDEFKKKVGMTQSTDHGSEPDCP